MQDINKSEAMDEYIDIIGTQEINLLNGEVIEFGRLQALQRDHLRFNNKISRSFNDWCEMKGYNLV